MEAAIEDESERGDKAEVLKGLVEEEVVGAGTTCGTESGLVDVVGMVVLCVWSVRLRVVVVGSDELEAAGKEAGAVENGFVAENGLGHGTVELAESGDALRAKMESTSAAGVESKMESNRGLCSVTSRGVNGSLVEATDELEVEVEAVSSIRPEESNVMMPLRGGTGGAAVEAESAAGG